MLSLRAYQDVAVARMIESLDRKERLLSCMPCGAGKTETAVAAMLHAVSQGKRCLFFAHRRELIKQTARRIRKYGAKAGIYMAGEMYTNDRIQVASIQTVASRKAMPRAELIIIDEAHLSLSPQYEAVLKAAKSDGIPVIGLTATPYRSDERQCFSELYDDYHVAIQPDELIKQGYQLKPEWYSDGNFERANELVKLRMKTGEYVAKDAEAYINEAGGFNTLRDNWIKHAEGLRTIVFCPTIAAAEGTCNELNKLGLGTWGMIDSKQGRTQNDNTIEAFSKGDIIGLVNVNMVSEGFDVPDCSCVILNTVTASSCRLVQSVGRCQRAGKDRAVVIDLGGHYARTDRIKYPNSRLILPWHNIVPQWESWETREKERMEMEAKAKTKEREDALVDLEGAALELVKMEDGTYAGDGMPADGVYSAKDASRLLHLMPNYAHQVHFAFGAITIAGGVVMPYKYADCFKRQGGTDGPQTDKEKSFAGRAKWINLARDLGGLSPEQIKAAEALRKQMIEQAKQDRLRKLETDNPPPNHSPNFYY